MPQPDPVPSRPPLARLSAERRAQIRQRLQAATPGPWEAHAAADVTGYPVYSLHGVSGDAKRDLAQHGRNADLIAHAPSDLAALLDELERRDALVTDALRARLRAKVEWPCVYLQVPVVPARKRVCNPALDPPHDWCDLCAMRFTADLLDALLGGGGGGQPQTPGDGQ